jgi:hypothetical protein
MTETGVKFSDAIISRVVCWRFSSPRIASAISGSYSASGMSTMLPVISSPRW